MTTLTALTEHEDHWLLPYRGLTVVQVRVSHQLDLMLEDGAEIRVECPATLATGAGSDLQTVELAPERQDVAAALTLFGGRGGIQKRIPAGGFR